LTNIVEQWGEMYAAVADSAKNGAKGGEYRLYGLNSKGSTGAQFAYQPGQQFNPIVPAAIVQELTADEAKFAWGSLKVSVAPTDARGGL
jgi:basic membrane protein A